MADSETDVDGVSQEPLSLQVSPDLGPPVEHTIEVELTVSEMLDGGRIVFWRDPYGWDGIVLEDGQLKYVNQGAERVMEQPLTVEEAQKRIQNHIDDPIAGGKGRFERGATPP